MSCFGCVKKRVCYLVDDNDGVLKDTNYNEEIGWCEECNICPEQGCQKQYAFRVHWTVGCPENPFHLYKDVCDKHVKSTPGGCSCSKTAREKSTHFYVYPKSQTCSEKTGLCRKE